MSHFGTNHEQLRPELVSIRQIQVNIPQALWLRLPDRAWRRRLKYTAAFHLLIGFSLAFFRKTIVWDEASVSSHFAQTGVNSSRKGEEALKYVVWWPPSRGPAGFTETANPGYSKIISAFYRMFTKSTQSENKGKFHGKSTPKDTQRQNIFSLSNKFWGNYL